MAIDAAVHLPARDDRRRDAAVIALVGYAHGTSHFFHLLLPPLFPWLMPAFGLSYTEAGFMMTVFFAVSGTGQALAGFVVDRYGSWRVLIGGMTVFVLAGLALSVADSYGALLLAAGLAGLGNSIFHPADFSLLNRSVAPGRLGHAFSIHGLSGNLGWAAGPALAVAFAGGIGWRAAGVAAAAVAATAILVLWLGRRRLQAGDGARPAGRPRTAAGPAFGFLGSALVWLCFCFFLVVTLAFGALQNFAPPLLQQLYGVSFAFAAACLTAYLVAAAAGMGVGGFLAAGRRHERVVAVALTIGASGALLLAAGVLPAAGLAVAMAVMGFGTGLAGPSRDLLVRRAAAQGAGGAYGRVYGFVYSGLDLGLAVAPVAFGAMMDRGRFGTVLVGVALCQAGAVLTALAVGRRAAAEPVA